MTAATPSLSRRAALGLAVTAPAGLLLSACSGSSVASRVSDGAERLEAPRSTPPAPSNPDRPTLDAAVEAVADVRATLTPHRTQDPLVDRLVQLHAAHLRALGAANASGTASPLGSGSLLAQVRGKEQGLATLLAAKAALAHEGDLARLLASMSAAVSQLLAGGAAWSTVPSPRAALRAALAGEHAAVYLLAALSSRTTTPGALADALRTSYDFHRAARDELAERLAALGDSAPPGAAPAYDLPGQLDSAAGVSAAALAVERSATVQYGNLVAATTGADRVRSIDWMRTTAVRQLAFGGTVSTLPGIG